MSSIIVRAYMQCLSDRLLLNIHVLLYYFYITVRIVDKNVVLIVNCKIRNKFVVSFKFIQYMPFCFDHKSPIQNNAICSNKNKYICQNKVEKFIIFPIQQTEN